MSRDILKSINKIKISVNENDQVLWECQAAEKCHNEATERLREECDQLTKEIAKIDEDIREIEPQIKILESNYDVQAECLPLSQESLINQRVYRKCLTEKIKNHQEEADKLIDEYVQYIQTCKEKLQLTNPTYKILQAKRTELRLSKIRCMDLQQKIVERESINKKKMEIKQKLFYSCIIEFAQFWVDKRKYLEAVSRLEQETRREKEYIQKLADVTELIKQKQLGRSLRKHTGNFSIPQIEFPANDGDHGNTVRTIGKAKTQVNNNFTDINTMLEKKDSDIPNISKRNEQQKPKFSTNNSKVRILENKTLKLGQESEKLSSFKSKEERSKEIAAKIQRVVQNFNKSISRQNSRKSVVLSQKSSQVDKKLENMNENLSQKSISANPECNKIEMSQNSQKNAYEENSAPQAIQNSNLGSKGLKKSDVAVLSQGSNQNTSQFPNTQHSYFNKENVTRKGNPAQKISKENREYNTNKFSQNTKLPSQAGVSITDNKNVVPLERVANSMSKNSQFCTNFNNRMEIDVPGEKPTFMMSASGLGNAFAATGRSNPITFPAASVETHINDNVAQCNNTSLEMFGYKPEFSMDMTDDYEGGLNCPDFNPNCMSQAEQENNTNMPINSSGVPNFITEGLFSFGQFKNPFSFK